MDVGTVVVPDVNIEEPGSVAPDTVAPEAGKQVHYRQAEVVAAQNSSDQHS
jgi:hypothetical protein